MNLEVERRRVLGVSRQGARAGIRDGRKATQKKLPLISEQRSLPGAIGFLYYERQRTLQCHHESIKREKCMLYAHKELLVT